MRRILRSATTYRSKGPGARADAAQLAEERAFVQRLLAGDEAAFDRLFDDYFGGLYRFAFSRLDHDQQLAKEIVHNTVCIAIEQLDTFRGEAALLTWLCGICRHEISAHRRREQRRPAQVELVEDAPEIRAVLESLAADAGGPEDELQRAEIARLVHLTLDHLPARYNRALQWKYFEGLPVSEIAARLEIGPKAAESVLTRAREAFRDGFERWSRGDGDRGLAPRRGRPARIRERSG